MSKVQSRHRGRPQAPEPCIPLRDPVDIVYYALLNAAIERGIPRGEFQRTTRRMINASIAAVGYAHQHAVLVLKAGIERDGGDLLKTFVRLARQFEHGRVIWPY
jgi:hypothetical protein